MMKSILHSKLMSLAAILAVDVLFFGATDPKNVSAPLLFAGFACVALTIYALARILMQAARLYGIKLGKHRKRTAGVVSASLVALLALQSIGQLTPRDVVVLVPIAAVLYMYVSYGKTKTAEYETL